MYSRKHGRNIELKKGHEKKCVTEFSVTHFVTSLTSIFYTSGMHN